MAFLTVMSGALEYKGIELVYKKTLRTNLTVPWPAMYIVNTVWPYHIEHSRNQKLVRYSGSSLYQNVY